MMCPFCIKVLKTYRRIDDNFRLFCRRPNIRYYNQFMSIIRFLLQSEILTVEEYDFLLGSARAVYES